MTKEKPLSNDEEELTEYDKKRIMEAIKQVKRGETMSFEELLKRVREKRDER